MKIACGFDHAGVSLRTVVFDAVKAAGCEVVDVGTDSTEAVDYPDIARSVAECLRSGKAERGVIACGSGAGVAVAANKFPGIRASVIHDTYSAHQAVEHDDLNVLCLGGRVIGVALAEEIIATYLKSRYTGEERHARRLNKVRMVEDEFSGDGGH